MDPLEKTGQVYTLMFLVVDANGNVLPGLDTIGARAQLVLPREDAGIPRPVYCKLIPSGIGYYGCARVWLPRPPKGGTQHGGIALDIPGYPSTVGNNNFSWDWREKREKAEYLNFRVKLWVQKVTHAVTKSTTETEVRGDKKTHQETTTITWQLTANGSFTMSANGELVLGPISLKLNAENPFTKELHLATLAAVEDPPLAILLGFLASLKAAEVALQASAKAGLSGSFTVGGGIQYGKTTTVVDTKELSVDITKSKVNSTTDSWETKITVKQGTINQTSSLPAIGTKARN